MGLRDLKLMLRWRWWVMVIALSPLLVVSVIVFLLVCLNEMVSAIVGYAEHLVSKAYNSKVVDVMYRFAFKIEK